MSAPRSPYAVGQLWRCVGRTPTETPTLLIDRIEQHPKGTGEILHVTIRDIQLRHPGLPGGMLTSMPHVPVIGQSLELSQAELVGEDAPDPAYLAGYTEWKAAFDAGHAGSFGIAVAEILDIIERQLSQRSAH